MKLCTVCNNHFEDDLNICPQDVAPLLYVGKQALLDYVLGDRYKVESIIGAGSMGVVYKAIQLTTGREMAVKVLHHAEGGADSAHVRRFKREAKAVSSLNHVNIVRLYDFGFMEDERPYIVTEFVKGKTLAQLLREKKRLEINEALPIIRQVCEGIAEAHSHKIVHRDLKPENIILQETNYSLEGNKRDTAFSQCVKVVDFGVAKLSADASTSSAALTVEGKVCGSPGYMSPEQCKGLPVDHKSDLYSLGIIMYEVICGQRPFSADTVMGLLFMHVNDQPPPMQALCFNLNIPTQLELVIEKALSKNSQDRQENVLELWHEFEAACQGKTINVPMPSSSHSLAGNWIPFLSAKEILLTDAALPLKPVQTSLSNSLNSSEQRSKPKPQERQRFKQSIFSWTMQISVLAGAIFLGVISETDLLSKLPIAKGQVEVANVLVERGRLSDAMIMMDFLKNQKKISKDEFESMNALYIEVASKYGKERNYANAIQALQHVSAKSKHFGQASQMLKRYRKLLTG